MEIKGITITLISHKKVGRDMFGHPIYKDITTEVENVLASPTTSDDVVNNQTLNTKKTLYTLAIPKGDDNQWEGSQVEFFGRVWQVVGIPLQGVEHLIPLAWNKKVTVEAIE